MFCGNCGTKLNDNLKFCTKCGTTIEAKGVQDSISRGLDLLPTKKGGFSMKKYILAFILICVVLFIASFISAFMSNRCPKNTSGKHNFTVMTYFPYREKCNYCGLVKEYQTTATINRQ